MTSADKLGMIVAVAVVIIFVGLGVGMSNVTEDNARPIVEQQKAVPITEDLMNRHICLPSHQSMTEKDAFYISEELLKIIKSRLDLGLELDNSVCSDFEKKSKHKNYLFSSAIDFIYEFFNFESKTNNYKMSKAFKFIDKNKNLKNFITKFKNNGIIN